MKVLFIGTSEFGIAPLRALIEHNRQISAVITQQDKLAGRGRKLLPSPIKVFAKNNNLKILQPPNINSSEIENFILENKIDIGIIVSYGQIIKENIFSIPKYKMINIHPSLLPKYRGPSPIQTALLNGDKITGVTIIQINEKMDEGDIISQKEIPIELNDNYFTLHEKLSNIGGDLLIESLDKFEKNNVKLIKQDNKKASYSKLITKELAKIDWNQTSKFIHNQIRALVKWPVAYTIFNNKILKIYESNPLSVKFNDMPPGYVVKLSKKSFGVVCGDGFVLEILKLQLQGKKILETLQFLNGMQIKTGDILN
jgi:methionyl-tRNA formyltransferase